MFRWVPNRLFYGSKSRLVKYMANPLDRIKILINSSTPIVVIETVEEMRARALIRSACTELNMAVFEWSIADGLVRSGSNAPVTPPTIQAQAEKISIWSSRDGITHSETKTSNSGGSEA